MKKKYLQDIFSQIRLLKEYELAQKTVRDEVVQPPPPDEQDIAPPKMEACHNSYR